MVVYVESVDIFKRAEQRRGLMLSLLLNVLKIANRIILTIFYF